MLIDPYKRPVNYLRVSVTDRCDFRCQYCMAENMKFLPKKDLLTLDEIDDYKLIKNIVSFFKKKNQKNFTCIDLVNLIKRNKNFSKINQKVKRTKYTV